MVGWRFAEPLGRIALRGRPEDWGHLRASLDEQIGYECDGARRGATDPDPGALGAFLRALDAFAVIADATVPGAPSRACQAAGARVHLALVGLRGNAARISLSRNVLEPLLEESLRDGPSAEDIAADLGALTGIREAILSRDPAADAALTEAHLRQVAARVPNAAGALRRCA